MTLAALFIAQATGVELSLWNQVALLLVAMVSSKGAAGVTGAGFITPLCGEMRTMPGLPSKPGGEKIDIDAEGNVVGLF